MRHRLLVAVLLLIAALYGTGMLLLAYLFVSTGSAIGVGLGISTLLILLLSAWSIVREVQFGIASGRLAARYADEQEHAPGAEGQRRYRAAGAAAPAGDPREDLEPLDDGAALGDAAERRAEFAAARAALQDPAAEADWRAWFRLSLAYDALRDRRNARMALRRAIAVRRGAS